MGTAIPFPSRPRMFPRLGRYPHAPVCAPAQLMGFPLSPQPYLPWEKSSLMTGLMMFMGAFRLSIAVFAHDLFKLVGCYFAIVWVCGQLACACWVGYNFISEKFTVMWPVKVRGQCWVTLRCGTLCVVVSWR